MTKKGCCGPTKKNHYQSQKLWRFEKQTQLCQSSNCAQASAALQSARSKLKALDEAWKPHVTWRCICSACLIWSTTTVDYGSSCTSFGSDCSKMLKQSAGFPSFWRVFCSAWCSLVALLLTAYSRGVSFVGAWMSSWLYSYWKSHITLVRSQCFQFGAIWIWIWRFRAQDTGCHSLLSCLVAAAVSIVPVYEFCVRLPVFEQVPGWLHKSHGRAEGPIDPVGLVQASSTEQPKNPFKFM